jgi:hypothetical protein
MRAGMREECGCVPESVVTPVDAKESESKVNLFKGGQYCMETTKTGEEESSLRRIRAGGRVIT